MSKKTLDKWRALIEHSWKGLDEHELLDYVNPFDFMTEYDKNNPDIYLLNLMRQPENFSLTCKLLFNIELMPFQGVILRNMWKTPFPIFLATRGGSKSYLSALYLLLRAIFLQGRKIVIIAPGFRQAKNVMNYIEGIWTKSPVVQDLFSGGTVESRIIHASDRWIMYIGHSTITALPLGIDGDRIRGERSNDTFIEEIQSFQGTEVLEKVVGGFSIVSSSPVEKVKQAARIKAMKDLGLIDEKKADEIKFASVKNQQIMCGTADYIWNHFAQYHAKWKKIIESRGKEEALKEIFTTSEGIVDIPQGFDWRDYAIIRLPVDLLPKDYMDEAQVARARATMHVGIFDMEYKTIFVRDSNGFYRASLIDSATATEKNVKAWENFFDEDMNFSASIGGRPGHQYVYGIDPASEINNFAIVILELHKTHRRIVHSWTFNKKRHRELIDAGLITETDYYGYCARKIRELLKVYPSEHVGLDAQGGGYAVIEALHNKGNMDDGEVAIWPVIKPGEPQPTDNYPGRHIVYPVQFANSKWNSDANHGMRKDLEDKKLIFPMFDSISLVEAAHYLQDQKTESLYNSLEDVMMDIEELKRELISIVHTVSKGGTERWDTPEVKISGQRKERQNKDRYSALVIANAIARDIDAIKAKPLILDGEGGFVGSRSYGVEGTMYSSHNYDVEDASDAFGFV